MPTSCIIEKLSTVILNGLSHNYSDLLATQIFGELVENRSWYHFNFARAIAKCKTKEYSPNRQIRVYGAWLL